jgi:hypothetical protein
MCRVHHLRGLQGRLAAQGCLAQNERQPRRRRFCSDIVLATLTMHMRDAGVLFRLPVAPCQGVSIRDLWAFTTRASLDIPYLTLLAVFFTAKRHAMRTESYKIGFYG